MPDARAQQLVTRLRGMGLSDSAIGKAVGLNSSAVAQIAGTSARTGAALANQRGAGYGATVAPALEQLAGRVGQRDVQGARLVASGLGRSGEIAAARPRRTVVSRSGSVREARVRQGTRSVGRSGLGRIITGSVDGTGRPFDNLLGYARGIDHQVSVRVNMDMGDGRTKWITLGAYQAVWWQGYREDWSEENGGPGRFGDFLEWMLDQLGAGGDLSSDVGEVIGWSAQVEA